MLKAETELRRDAEAITDRLKKMQGKVKAIGCTRQQRGSLKLMLANLLRDADGLRKYLYSLELENHG